MGIGSLPTTTTRYFSADGSPLKFDHLSGLDPSESKKSVAIKPVAICDQNLAPIFRNIKVTSGAFVRGYTPHFLDDSGISNAMAGWHADLINLEYRFKISRQGKLMVPETLLPLKAMFRQAAGYFTGLGGSLQPNRSVILNLARNIVNLPGEATAHTPHCDFSESKRKSYRGMSAIILSTADYRGTVFYPDASLNDVTPFVDGKRMTRSTPPGTDYTKNTLTAPAGKWVLSTDLHVHGAPFVPVDHVPPAERSYWEEVDNKTNEVVARGRFCLRNFMHMAFERG